MGAFLKRLACASLAFCLVLVPSCLGGSADWSAFVTRVAPVALTALAGGCLAPIASPTSTAPQQTGPVTSTPQQTAPVSNSSNAGGGTATANPSVNLNLNAPAGGANATRPAS